MADNTPQSNKQLALLTAVVTQRATSLNDQINNVLAQTLTLLEMDIGIVSQVVGDLYTIRYLQTQHNEHEDIVVGRQLPLKDTYSQIAAEERETFAHHHIGESDYKDHDEYKRFGLESCLTTPIFVDDELYGTLSFSGHKPHAPFSEEEKQLVQLLAEWVGSILTRRQVEERLKQSQAFQNAILRNADYVIMATDTNGIIQMFNPAAEEVLGYTADELVGQVTIDKLYDQNEIEAYAAKLSDELGQTIPADARALVTKTNREAENVWHLVPKDGGRIPARISINTLRDEHGTPIGYVGIGTDITEEEQAEERFRILFNHASDGYLLIDEDNLIQDCNQTAVEMLGAADKDEIIGRRPLELSPERQPDGQLSAESGEKLSNTAREEGYARFEWHHRRLDNGETFPVEVTLSSITLSNGREMQLVEWHEIAERLAAEEELRVERERLAMAIRGTGEGIWEWNLITDEVFFSDRWKEMLGYQPHELENRLGVWENLIHPLDGDNTMERLNGYLSGEYDTYEAEFRMKTKQGDWRWIMARGFALRDENGKPYRMGGSHRDITDKKKAEQDIQIRTRAIEASIDPITIADALQPDMPLIYVNNAFVEVTGYPREEVIGRNCRFLQGDHTNQPGLDTLREAIKHGRSCVVELRNFRKDGTPFWNELQLSPVRDKDGILTHYVGIQNDITETREREIELRRYAAQLSGVSHIAATIATADSEDQLLTQVSDMIRDDFGLYHAQIYLLDEAGKTLILTAGAGIIGEMMVEEGREIPLHQERSLVARAARTRQGVMINNVGQDTGFLSHPLLSITASELAVPIIAQDKVLGVIDIQEDSINAFSQRDLEIHSTLATQVAIALQNVNAFEQLENTLEDMNTLTRRLTRSGWEEYLQSRTTTAPGFEYDLSHLRELHQPDIPAEATDDGLIRSLQVQGATIGRLAVDNPQVLTEDADEIMTAVVERLSDHIENIRLTDQTQLALAETEEQAQRLTQLNELGAALNQAETMQEMWITAVQRTGQIFGIAGSSISLLDSDGDRFQIVAYEGFSRDDDTTGSLPLKNSMVHEAITQQKIIRLNDLSKSRYVEARLLRSRGLKAAMVAPIRVSGQIIGTLNLGSDSPHTFNDRDESLVQQMVTLLGTTMENRRLLAQAEARATRERQVRDITDKIRRSTDRNAILRTAREEIGRLIGAGKSNAWVGNTDDLYEKQENGRSEVSE